MIITISGHPGSGKTSIGKILAKKLGYDFVSIGDIRGQMALERGITISELNEIGEKEDWTDLIADEKLKEFAKKDNMVIDSRIAFHLIPKSVKIFLNVSFEEGAKRIIGDKRNDQIIGKTIQEQIMFIKEMIQSDRKRHKKHHDILYDNKEYFDLYLDTSDLSKEQVVQKILGFLKDHSNKQTT